jgi:hypothetical protein
MKSWYKTKNIGGGGGGGGGDAIPLSRNIQKIHTEKYVN